MGESRQGHRTLVRSMGARVRRPSSLRTTRQQRWERKWEQTTTFPWQVDEVPPELDVAVSSGWVPPGVPVLDLGCGDGLSAAWLARRGHPVLGIDFAPAAVTRARERFGGVPGLAFDVVDVCRPGALADRTFGALVDRGCLSNVHPRLRADYAGNVAAWAAPGAPFLLSMVGRDEGLERRHAIEMLLGKAFVFEDVSLTEGMVTIGGVSRSGVVFHLRRRTG